MSSEKVPAFQFYPKDFLTDERVRLMTHTERGIYITLLCMCWLEGSLPTEPVQLAKLVEVPAPRFARLWKGNLSSCFKVQSDRLVHGRLEKEREKQETYRQRQTDAAASRWHKPDDAKPMPGVAIPAQCSPISDLHLPSSSPKQIPRGRDADLAERAGALLRRYDELYRTHRHGALTLIKGPVDFDRACKLCETWPSDRLEKMAVIFLETDDEWVMRTDRGFGVFVSRAAWCDDRLTQWELAHASAV